MIPFLCKCDLKAQSHYICTSFTCESFSMVFSVCESKLEAASTAVLQAWWKVLSAKVFLKNYHFKDIKQQIVGNDRLAWRSLWCCVSCSLSTSIHGLLPLFRKVLPPNLLQNHQSICDLLPLLRGSVGLLSEWERGNNNPILKTPDLKQDTSWGSRGGRA